MSGRNLPRGPRSRHRRRSSRPAAPGLLRRRRRAAGLSPPAAHDARNRPKHPSPGSRRAPAANRGTDRRRGRSSGPCRCQGSGLPTSHRVSVRPASRISLSIQHPPGPPGTPPPWPRGSSVARPVTGSVSLTEVENAGPGAQAGHHGTVPGIGPVLPDRARGRALDDSVDAADRSRAVSWQHAVFRPEPGRGRITTGPRPGVRCFQGWKA